MSDPMIPYGAGLTMEQRLARVEQRMADSGLLIPKSLGTTKGDMLVHNGTDWERLPAAPGSGYTTFSDSSQSGGVQWQQPLHCHVYATAAVVVSVTPIATWVAVPMANELTDQGGLHSTSSNTDRINLLRAGIWEVGFRHLWLASTGYTSGRVQSRVLKNGATTVDYDQVDVWSGGKNQQPFTQGTTLVSSNGSDYVASQALYDAGTTQIVSAGGVLGFTYLWARYIGPS